MKYIEMEVNSPRLPWKLDNKEPNINSKPEHFEGTLNRTS